MKPRLNLSANGRHVEHSILVSVSYELVVGGHPLLSVNPEQPLVEDHHSVVALYSLREVIEDVV